MSTSGLASSALASPQVGCPGQADQAQHRLDPVAADLRRHRLHPQVVAGSAAWMDAG
jgi:hypothetical protein